MRVIVLAGFILAGFILLFGCVSGEVDYSEGSSASGSGGSGYDYKITHPSSLSDCDIAKDSDDRSMCMMFVGRDRRDASICDSLASDSYLYECYSGVVLGKGDLSICERLGSNAPSCYEITAAECCAGGRADSPSVCDELQNKGYDSC